MNVYRFKMSVTICILALLSLMTAGNAVAQSMTAPQLATLVPGEQDLQGFIKVVPQAELPSQEIWSQRDQRWEIIEAQAMSAEDNVVLNLNSDQITGFWRPITVQSGKYSLLSRCLWSANGLYKLEIRVAVCDSAATARRELEKVCQQSQIALVQGTYSGVLQLGDESWIYPASEERVIRVRCGKLLFVVSGQPSRIARGLVAEFDFPPAAVEAVAYQILLRASQQPELTGVSAEQATLAVNGHALPKGALRVAGQTYVPVKAFAQAMGLTAGWNVKTGALTLTGPNGKTFALTAGSTAVGGGGTLQVPVLKQAGQPVMTLDDLLRLTGGHVTARKASEAQ